MYRGVFLILFIWLVSFSCSRFSLADPPQPSGNDYGRIIYQSKYGVIWSCPSEYKVGKYWKCPSARSEVINIALARNEYEAYQLIITPKVDLAGVKIYCGDLKKSDAVLMRKNVDILQVGYVHIKRSTDGAYPKGFWPDPLFPVEKPLTLQADRNYPFWIRVYAPKNVLSGIYRGKITVSSDKLNVEIPLEVRIFNFQLPDEMSCKSAFGARFSEVWKYHHLKSNSDRKIVLEKYLESFSRHHISPYNCIPLGPSRDLIVSIPENIDSRLFPIGGEYVTNEAHTGKNSLIVFDNDGKKSIYAESRKVLLPRVKKAKRIKVSMWYRTLLPERMGSVWIRFYDKSGKQVKSWLKNFCGSGKWEKFEHMINGIPSKAEYLKIFLYPAVWTVKGQNVGTVWFDDIQIEIDGRKLINPNRGSFETEKNTFTPEEYRKLYKGVKVILKHGEEWAKTICDVISKYHFNTFYLWIRGMGGLSNSAISPPKYHSEEGRVYTEESLEYKIIFEKYIRQLRDLLREYNLLDKAYVYQYDEPIESHIPFVKRNYGRLRKFAPEIKILMATDRISNQLMDLIDYWVIIHHAVDNKDVANINVIKWDYICCYPRAPYIGEFIDHPGIDLRLWLWQVFSRGLKGILIWETLYWRADKSKLGNPYENPMSTSASHGWDWGNGDGRLLYPPLECFKADKPVIKGPVESIRWEMIRDGIEDYEYLTILSNLIRKNHFKTAGKYRKLLSLPPEITSLKKHTKNPSVLSQLRLKVAEAIERLTSLN